MTGWLEPSLTSPLDGSEAFDGADLSVADFWRWAFSDLRENIVRGVLAEFLVAKAVGDPSPARRAWHAYDVTTPGGARIEVKSSAYLQSWRQKELSRIVFTGLSARAFSYETNNLEIEPTYRADIYVFALHLCQVPDQYDPLDLGSWRFYVMSVDRLRAAGSPKSVSKAFLDRDGVEPVGYDELAEAVGRVEPKA